MADAADAAGAPLGAPEPSDTLAEVQAKLAAAEARAVALEVAAAKGIPADLLTGPGDDLEGYADRLAAYIADKTPAAPAAGRHINSAATPDRVVIPPISWQDILRGRRGF